MRPGRGRRGIDEVVGQRGGTRQKRQQRNIRKVKIARDGPVVRGAVYGVGGGKQSVEREESGRSGEEERKGRSNVLELRHVGISEKGRGEFGGKERLRMPRRARLRRMGEPGRGVEEAERVKQTELSRRKEEGREEGSEGMGGRARELGGPFAEVT